MKIVALGANLPSDYGTPVQTLAAAAKAMNARGLRITHYSRIWKTAPVPFNPAHPWYHNAVAAVETKLTPDELLAALLAIEEEFGRVRTVKNAPRLLDLDLIAYDEEIVSGGPDIIVPHPRMHERGFVLHPLSDINSSWVHPQSKRSLSDLIAALPDDQQAEATDEVWHD
jgi:2-amino-4-hydroxy-6-hydroxymethyldihydropteridine diphosphokinase